MIRPAVFADITQLIGLLKDAHARSPKYATRATFDDKTCQRALLNAIKLHGTKIEGGTWCVVSEEKNILNGLLFGMTMRVEDFAHELLATDWKFLVMPGAAVTVATDLRDSFIRWAEAQPRVIEMYVGVHDVVDADFERAGVLWTRRGFRKTGALFEKIIVRENARSVA